MNELLFTDTPFQRKLSAIEDLLRESTINAWQITPQLDGKSVHIRMFTEEQMINEMYNTEDEADYSKCLLDILMIVMPVKDLDINS